ncbi:MAG: hypothetical protein WHW07_00220 [Bacteroidales bacterium]|jgi:hypothetical protein|nr:hypothetical protein [Bacteroidales bacterium]HOL97823.1 hypothetical protein [Bacteroidales bacterium]HOM35872.1 hypothetical protein [Bacteroidales bacterium]HPD23209.1 hypothetical protein [Bacteroidales bacterium]HRS99213.1 hypothetical protein [Bacteroidales bacterium]
MKKLVYILVFVSVNMFVKAEEKDFPKKSGGETIVEYSVSVSNPVIQTKIIPYSVPNYVEMQKVTERENYELWKVAANQIRPYPGQKLVGKSFNYFVFRDGKFHFTVTEMNKDAVYKFFSGQI